MHDTTLWAAGMRLPVVMVNVNREPPSLPSVSCSRQDMMTVRDSGWIQIEVETCQEILDTVIMAFRLAEDEEILLPVMVSYDGFYLSYYSEGVYVPCLDDVATFMHPLSLQKGRPRVAPGDVYCFPSYADRELATEFRYKHCAALERTKNKLKDIEKEFAAIFGRTYGGAIEEYRTEDAEIVLVTMGSSTGTARVVVDKKRDEGIRVGLIKIRLFRPFPTEELLRALTMKKCIGILDRSVCFGWNCGHLYMELGAALGTRGISVPMVDFVAGLAQADITPEDIDRAIDEIYRASQGEPVNNVTWLSLE
jgi:pyruvate/2-oxoacid:ferredoxin oxidoreductase alpha subunit